MGDSSEMASREDIKRALHLIVEERLRDCENGSLYTASGRPDVVKIKDLLLPDPEYPPFTDRHLGVIIDFKNLPPSERSQLVDEVLGIHLPLN